MHDLHFHHEPSCACYLAEHLGEPPEKKTKSKLTTISNLTTILNFKTVHWFRLTHYKNNFTDQVADFTVNLKNVKQVNLLH